MGALTTKRFPFESRGWDVEKFESIDPTDGFALSIKVYIINNQIVLIEPDSSTDTSNVWITDKCRQFFDGIFAKNWSVKSNDFKVNDVQLRVKKPEIDILKSIVESIYIFEHCNYKQKIHKKFFIILFESLSLEILNLLLILQHNYSFIKLKRAESIQIQNDLELKFQLNSVYRKINLKLSTLCFIIATNPRYEGYFLNSNLRQRFLKGNFKCTILGSLLNLSFPVSFLGSNLNTFKTITEGNSLTCQNLKSAKNPIFIFNNELFKRNDNNNLFQMLENLNNFSTFTFSWNGINMLNSSLSENGIHFLSKFQALKAKDLNNISNLYFINVSANNSPNLNKITELKLLTYSLPIEKNCFAAHLLRVWWEPARLLRAWRDPEDYTTYTRKLRFPKPLFFDQNYKINNNIKFFQNLQKKLLEKFNNIDTEKFFSLKTRLNYKHIPSNVLYENEETFLNTEGFFKRTLKVVSKNHNKNGWQLLRKLARNLKKNLVSLDKKNNELLLFNTNKLINFKNFIFFQFYPIQSLNNLNFYLILKTSPVFYIKKHLMFKTSQKKFKNTKTKYWLDDFFTNGKDEYSQQSLVLTKCSILKRFESTNFF